MPTKEKSTDMLQSLLLYSKQRFNPATFALLALFLLLFAVGQAAMLVQHLPHFVLLLALLYLFRLSDDLANAEVDAAKANRIYTQPVPHRQLLRFCLGYTLVLLLSLGWLYRQAGLLLLGFLLLHAAAYYVLFHKGQWRFVLPLLKYPFLCFLIGFMLKAPATTTTAHALGSVALLPVFLLFEHLSDPDFRLTTRQATALFVVAHGLLWLAYPPAALYLPLVALVVLVLLWRHLKRTAAIPYAPYLLLLYFLVVRLVSGDVVDGGSESKFLTNLKSYDAKLKATTVHELKIPLGEGGRGIDQDSRRNKTSAAAKPGISANRNEYAH